MVVLSKKGVMWAEVSVMSLFPSLETNSACKIFCRRAADRLCRRRYHKSNPTRATMIRPQIPATIPPMAPPLNLRSDGGQRGGGRLEVMTATHEDGGEPLLTFVLSLSDDISSLPNNKIKEHAHGDVKTLA